MATPNPATNPFLLAADASPALLPLLRATPSLASSQDAHGYSLLHALTSYNHVSLLRTISREFSIPADLRDEDDETALFVAETVAAAQALVEELGVDASLRNKEGQTAEEKIREEGDFVTVSDYLREARVRGAGGVDDAAVVGHPPPLPNGVKVNMGTMEEEEDLGEVDESFRRRIEELASREDFSAEEGQRELRELVQDAMRDVGTEGREVRRRVD